MLFKKEELLDLNEESKLLNEKKMICKRRLSWLILPDKNEQWLEKMCRNGFIFYKMDRIGFEFLFIKGIPKKIKYVWDYQKKIDLDYFDTYKENGWKLEYAKQNELSALTIWSKEYQEELSAFYVDKKKKLKQVRNNLLFNLFQFLPLCALSINLIILNNNLKPEMSLYLFDFVLFPFLMFVTISQTIRYTLYYFRMRKLLKE